MNHLLPKPKPGLCFFITLRKVLKPYIDVPIYHLFFFAEGFRFLYYSSENSDIQQKYEFFDHGTVLKKLSEIYGFRYQYRAIDQLGRLDSNDLVQALSKKQSVMLTIDIAALPYGEAQANSLRDQTFHCVRAMDYDGVSILIYDDYIPAGNNRFQTAKLQLNYQELEPYIKNYAVIQPPSVRPGEKELKKQIVCCVDSFLHPIKQGNRFSGVDAVALFMEDITLAIRAEGIEQSRNLMGLLFIIKYQIYPAYYYFIEALTDLLVLSDEIERRIGQINDLWKAVFIKLELFIIQSDQRQAERLKNGFSELMSRFESFLYESYALWKEAERGKDETDGYTK